MAALGSFPVSPLPPKGLLRCHPTLSSLQSLGTPAGLVLAGLRSSPATPAPTSRPPAPRGTWRAALIVSMGDDFQGEISSSVESLSFKAAHKMSSPPCSARDVLLSRCI